LHEGYNADILLVEPQAERAITLNTFLRIAKYFPFEEMRGRGEAVCTIMNDSVIENGEIVGPPTARIIRSDE
jgi:dihydroorotase-like cyclic amidohydrolase